MSLKAPNLLRQIKYLCCEIFQATTNAVKVSDVTFKYFKGTCEDVVAVKLDCDRELQCGNIVMEHINITSSSPKTPLTSFCRFANVISHFVSIDIKCGSHEDPQAPSPYPQPPAPYANPPAPHAQPPTPIAQPPLFFPFLYMF